MTQLKFQATEMKSAKVERISLVTRGATRIPFRVIKEDQTMKSPFGDVDLARVFARKADKTPVVTGIVTMKGEGFDALKAKIGEAGFVVEKSAEQKDGETTVVTFAQGDEPVDEKDVVIKMSPDVAVVVKGFRPYAVDMSVGDTSFSEACSAQGFYPGLSTMVDVLRSSVYELVGKGDDPQDAAKSVAKMFDEAKQYCVSMVTALPSKAFKLEAVVSDDPEDKPAPAAAAAEPAKKTDAELAADEAAKVAAAAGTGATATGDEVKKGEKAPAADAAAAAAAATPAVVSALKAEDVEKLIGAAFATMSEKLTATVTGVVGEVQKSVKEVNESVTALGARVQQVEGVAKAAQEAVEGTVMGSDADDHVTGVQKSDKGGSRGRELDTGYTDTRRTRRAA